MLRSPYLLTDQHLHSPTPVVPSISAPSTPLRQHGISSVGNVSSVLQKGTCGFTTDMFFSALKKKFTSDFRFFLKRRKSALQLKRRQLCSQVKKCLRHVIYARACVNKDFVHSGSIGLI